jgi:hypothetical protein
MIFRCQNNKDIRELLAPYTADDNENGKKRNDSDSTNVSKEGQTPHGINASKKHLKQSEIDQTQEKTFQKSSNTAPSRSVTYAATSYRPMPAHIRQKLSSRNSVYNEQEQDTRHLKGHTHVDKNHVHKH